MKQSKKIEKCKVYFSSTETLDNWTGGNGFYELLFQIEIFRFRFCLWRLPKFIDLNKKGGK